VLVAAMIPAPAESPGAWWANTGHEQARRELDIREGRDPDAEFDVLTTFMHDVPPDVIDDAMAHGAKNQSSTPFKKPWPLEAWPSVPTRFLLCLSDRFFPADFM